VSNQLDTGGTEHPAQASGAIPQGRFEVVPISQIRKNPQNPRLHNRHQVRVLARNIRRLGYNAPILIDKSGMIVSGHARVEALKMLGVEEVSVVRLDHLSEEQVKAYMIADNRIAEMSAFGDQELALVLKELYEINLDVVAESTGFDIAEIELRIQSLEPPEEGDADDDVEVPNGEPVSRLGDLWRLGRNHVLCASALEIASYEVLLAGEKASAVFTDPPYNVPIDGHVTGKGSKRHREFPMASGEMTSKGYCEFLKQGFGLMAAHSADDATFYACMDWRHIEEIAHAIRAGGCELLKLCVWVKTNAGMGSLYPAHRGRMG